MDNDSEIIKGPDVGMQTIIESVLAKHGLKVNVIENDHGVQYGFKVEDPVLREKIQNEIHDALGLDEPSAGKYQDKLNEIMDYMSYKAGWDGPGSLPMNADLLVLVCPLLESLAKNPIRIEIETELASDGALGLDFRLGGKTLSLDIAPKEGEQMFKVTASAAPWNLGSPVEVKTMQDLSEVWFAWFFE